MTNEKFNTYLFSYYKDDEQWCFDLPATSFKDAEDRLNAIRRTGQMDGRLYLRIRVPKWFDRFGAFFQPPV